MLLIYNLLNYLIADFTLIIPEFCQLKHSKSQEYIDNLICEGFSAHQLINQLLDDVVTSTSMSDNNKAEICEKLALAESCLLDGADEYLQIMSVATTIMKAVWGMDFLRTSKTRNLL